MNLSLTDQKGNTALHLACSNVSIAHCMPWPSVSNMSVAAVGQWSFIIICIICSNQKFYFVTGANRLVGGTLNEWMMHLYSALLCIAVHPKCFTIMWGVSSTTTSGLRYSAVVLRASEFESWLVHLSQSPRNYIFTSVTSNSLNQRFSLYLLTPKSYFIVFY